MRRSRPSLIAVVVGVVFLAGCAGSGDPDVAASDEPVTAAPTSSAAPGDELEGSLTIYAAASLKASFDELAGQFEELHPDLVVAPIVYDGSSTLVTQLIEGAPADVFASADERNMDTAVDATIVDAPVLFATNTLVIAVPAGNPGDVTGLASLADPELDIILCAPEVPCGGASETLLANEGVTVTPASLEQNVTAVLTKVAAGEADAGLVYRTDVVGNDQVESLVPEGAEEVVNRYPIAVLTDAENPAAAAAFAEFVLGEAGHTVLADHGFGAP